MERPPLGSEGCDLVPGLSALGWKPPYLEPTGSTGPLSAPRGGAGAQSRGRRTAVWSGSPALASGRTDLSCRVCLLVPVPYSCSPLKPHLTSCVSLLALLLFVSLHVSGHFCVSSFSVSRALLPSPPPTLLSLGEKSLEYGFSETRLCHRQQHWVLCASCFIKAPFPSQIAQAQPMGLAGELAQLLPVPPR